MIGASGAISGVLGAYLLFYPNARVLTLMPMGYYSQGTMEVPAIFFLGLWFVMQLFTGIVPLATGTSHPRGQWRSGFLGSCWWLCCWCLNV